MQALFGAAPAVDMGLAGKAMPGAANTPQVMAFDAAKGWFVAEGIPITPTDDANQKNPYPMMRLVARNAAGTVIASTDIVLPVSDEMDCRGCHASNSNPAARPSGGWVNDPDAVRDYRLNILRLHDDRRGSSSTYANALATVGYDPAGLYTTVTAGATPILCARCHASEALAAGGVAGIPQLTSVVHSGHAAVVDPTNGLTLDASANRSACYRCHPGSETRCLRGAMGRAVAADGTPAMQCQSCHGSMSAVGASSRRGWLDEPGCGSCHTGTATQNSGQIRYTSALLASGQPRVPASTMFATNANTPAAGISLYRFSRGHGNLYCEACHGSTHAEVPSSHVNDNVAASQLQGHEGVIGECNACHNTQPSTTTGGPHGMHPVGSTWVSGHQNPGGNEASCAPCHGTDYRGTVLSRTFGDRTLSAFGTKQWWRGFQVGCYSCHNGPNSENGSSNRAPVASNRTATTAAGVAVAISLVATDPDGNALEYRIVGQPAHGATGVSSSTATYVPMAGFSGLDSFTYAAWDGSTNSNLATVTVTVAEPACTVTVTAPSALTGTVGVAVTFTANVTTNGTCTGAPAYDWYFGDGTPHSTEASPSHVYGAAGIYNWTLGVTFGTFTGIASGQITIADAPVQYAYMFFVAHNPGLEGTSWRSDVSVLNASDTDATLTFTLHQAGGAVPVSIDPLPVNSCVEFVDAVASLFQLVGDASGPVTVTSNTPVNITSRVYTPFGGGTMGQSYPAATVADTIEPGVEGLLPQLQDAGEFRTSVGFLNLSAVPASVAVDFFEGSGSKIGPTLVANVPPLGWVQLNDVLAGVAAGGTGVVWGRVQVHSSGSKVWAYASVIDNVTGDPTTIAMSRR